MCVGVLLAACLRLCVCVCVRRCSADPDVLEKQLSRPMRGLTSLSLSTSSAGHPTGHR